MKQADYQVASGAKITCARFGATNYQLLAAGDDQKNITLWKLNRDKPKLMLQGHTSEVTQLSFSNTAEQIYSGSQGGTVHVWDLSSSREINKLKGHLTACTCLAGDNQNSTMLVTGSEDTKAKVWDLRMKQNQCVGTFKEHTGAITSVQMSPDSRWVASGSLDGSVKIWEISSQKVLANFNLPNQQVTCIEFNPQNLALANGSTDKTVKYWDLEQFSNINITPMDSSTITNLTFCDDNSEFLFAASSENIKLWNIETNKMLDCLSIIPKTISDLKIANYERFLLMSAIANNTISIWYSPLENINFDETIDIIPSSDSAKSQVSQSMDIDYQNNQQKSSVIKSYQTSEELHQQQMQILKQNPFADPQSKFAQEPKQPAKQVPQKQEQIDMDTDDLNRATYIKAPSDKPLGLDLNNFAQQPTQKKDLEIINEVMEQHTTLVGVVQRRMSSIKVILNWWNKGNITSAINALNMMNDMSVVMDVLNNTFAENQRIDMLNYENIAAIIPHCTSLVNSKYETHILAGLKATHNILKAFAQQIIQIKTLPVGGGVDLAREERVKKCDACVDQFLNFFKSKGFQKALKRKGEVAEVAMTLHVQLNSFLNKTKGQLDAE